MLASVSKVQAGDTLVYLISFSVTGQTMAGVTLTDVLPVLESLTAFVTSPAGAAASQNGQNLQWVFTPLAPGNYSVSYSVKISNFLAGGILLTNTAQITAPGLPAQTASVTLTTTGNYTVKVWVYNGAGEVVKQILVETFSQPLVNIQLSSGALIQSLTAQVGIYDDGFLLGNWDGNNQQGLPVSNGRYYIQVENIDPVGNVTSVTQEVTVNRPTASVSVNIYNAAGEVVRHLYGLVDDPGGGSMTSVALSTSVVEPNAAIGTAPTQVVIGIGGPGVPLTLTWDGKNDSGQVVTPGYYLIGVHWDNGQGGSTDITRGIVVENGGSSARVFAAPNLLTASSEPTTFISGDPNVKTLSASIYTVAGELVTRVEGIPGTGQAIWAPGRAASGFYIAVVTTRDSNGYFLSRQTLKLVVRH